jgi:hypothetical protein
MPKVTPPLVNFNAGELSPLIDARFDIDKYQNGCQKLENAFPLVEGGVKKTPGTYYITSTKYSDRKARLVPFVFNTEQAYHVEMGDLYMRFFKDNGLIALDADDIDDFSPGEEYAVGIYTKLGPYGTYTWSGGKQLNIAFPYGESYSAISITANTSDALSVSVVGTTLTIKLANTTSSKNTATLIQTAIRDLGGIYSDCTVTANPAYSLSVPITAPATSALVTTDSIYKCIQAVTGGPAGVFTWTSGNKILTITKAGTSITVEANTSDVLSGSFATGIALKLADTTVTKNAALFVQWIIRSQAAYTEAIATGNSAYDASPPKTTPDTSVVYGEETSYFPSNSTYWESASESDIVEIATEYALADLFDIDVHNQSADVLYLFHENYPPRKLIRHSHANWEIVTMNITGTSDVAKTGQRGIAKGINWISKTNPCEIKARRHGLSVGDMIFIDGVTEMTDPNEGTFIVCQVVDENQFYIQVDSTNWTKYPSDTDVGTIVQVVPMFNQEGDYPACGAFFGQRLYLGGSKNNPLRLNGSVISDFENFISNPSKDDYAVQYDIASGSVDRVRWMVGQKALMLGTAGGIFKATGATAAEPLTQKSINISKEVYTGVSNIQPILAGDSIVWVTRESTVVRLLQYLWEQDKWTYPDLTRLSRHITIGADRADSGIIQAAFQNEPYPIIWCLRSDGVLLGMTYESQEQVYAWFKIITDGEIESFSIVSQDNNEDQMMLIVKRTKNGADVRYVEYLKEYELFSEIKDAFFVHCGLSWDGGDGVAITGITKANPPVVTAANHGFVNGDHVSISDVVGMTEANCKNTEAFFVQGKTTNTFQLYGKNSTNWTAYTSGGTVKKVTKTISSGLTHLEGETVDVVIDGAVIPQKVVASGAIDLDGVYGNKIHVGLPYTTKIKTMKLHAGSQTGTSRGKKQKANKATLIFHETVGGKYGMDEDNLFDIPFGYGNQPVLTSDDIDVDLPGDWDDKAEVVIVHDQPLPFTLKGIIPRITTNDD